MLVELPGPLGLLLWQISRDVTLWSQSPAEERATLFAPGAAAARESLEEAALAETQIGACLPALRRLLRQPGAAAPAEVAGACTGISAWAEVQGALATALAFAQAAALADAGHAEPALAVARAAGRRGDHARAELWFRRATGIARRTRDWRHYARAFSGLGTLYRNRGNLPAAHRFHLRALRGARRGGLRAEHAVALHDLFGVSVEAGRIREAQRYAREAFAAYPPRSPRVAALAHDVAYFWMEQGDFSRALPLLEAVEPLVSRPEERLWVAADLMRAAAGAGDSARARRMTVRVRELCAQPALESAGARAQLELGRGLLQLGETGDAAEAATLALELARANREGRTVLAAESLLDAIAAGRVAGPSVRGGGRNDRDGAGDPASAPTVAADDGGLAAALLRSLQELATERAGSASASLDAHDDRLKDLTQPEAHTRG